MRLAHDTVAAMGWTSALAIGAVLLWANCSPASDGPRIDDAYPTAAEWGGTLYVRGARLAGSGGRAWVTLRSLGDDGLATWEVELSNGVAERLAVPLPPNPPEGFGSVVYSVTVRTEAGLADWSSRSIELTDAPILPTPESDDVAADQGLVGDVVRLREGIDDLPDGRETCDDGAVDPRAACPYATVFVNQLAIDERPFEGGVPGLDGPLTSGFAVVWRGTLDLPPSADSEHRLTVCADEPAALYLQVDEQPLRVVDHRATEACTTGGAELPAGPYPLTVVHTHWEPGELSLSLGWETDGGEVVVVPADALHPP